MFTRPYEAMLEEFQAALAELGRNGQEQLKWLGGCVELSFAYMKRLKKYFLRNEPASVEDEVIFFKTVKPKFKSQLLFHQSVLELEGRRPPGLEAQSSYYLGELEQVAQYFSSNAAFYDYVRRDAAHLDQHYYRRGHFDVHLCPHEQLVDFDERFNTSHDTKLAELLANELLLAYLERRIEKVNNKASGSFADFFGEEVYSWTENQSAFVEWCYGMVAAEAVNHGKVVIANFIHYMEKVFHVSVKNFYGTYNDISERANQTLFIDKVKKALIDRMNQ